MFKGFFINQALGWTAGKLDGYKTKIGGTGLILAAIVGLIGQMFPDTGLPKTDIDTIMMQFSMGFVAWGLGGKAEKVIKTQRENQTGGQ